MIDTSSFSAFSNLFSHESSSLALAKTLGRYKDNWVYVGAMDRRPSLYVFEPDASKIQEMQSSHLKMELVEVNLEGVPSGKFIRLAPLGSDFDLGLFASICDEFIRAADFCEDASTELVELVARWAALLKVASNTESANKLVGLFGELFCLRELLKNFGPVAITSWTGPDSARHDFESGKWAIEVKSSTVQAERRAVIHGAGQLDATSSTSLCMVHYQLEWAQGAESLGALVEDVSGLLDGLGKKKFFENLEKLGFNRSALERNSAASIKINRVSLFSIDENFPRITLASVSTLQPHLTRVDYWLTLEGLPSEDCTENYAPLHDRISF
jgi:hypothetical protein